MRKVYVYFDSADGAARSTVEAGVGEVVAIYGMRTLARATDEQSRALIEAGFRVELADREDLLMLDSVIIDTTAPAPAPPADWTSPGNDVWLVQFVGPPLPDWVEAVRDAGAEVLSLVSSSALMVRMINAQAQAVEDLGRVQWIGRYEPLYKIHPELAGEDGPVPAAELERLATADDPEGGPAAEEAYVEIEVFSPSDLSEVASVMEANGGSIEEAAGNIVIGHLPRAAIRTIARMPETARVSRFAPPGPDLQRARPVTSVQVVVDTHGLDGEGEIVAVADTGLDRGADNDGLHTDFKELDGVTTGRVIRGYALGRPGRWDDPNGHGTHVAGIAVGNGMSTPGRDQSGVAYKSLLVMQSVLDPAGGWTGLPTNVNTLFTPVYDNDGARVHNNSWGTSAALTSYGARARQVDQFVWRNPDMVIVFSAGNSGTDRTTLATGAPPADGVVDFGSVGQEKTFRNGVAVGASENNRPEIATQYGPAIPGRYPVEPLRSDPLANAPEQMSPFSSRGPTNGASGNRIKPDVVAPGASIFAPFSPISPTSNGWGPRPAGSPYIYQGGTSQAAPHVAGMCALIRQYLREVHGLSDPSNPNRRRRRPSAALIKALLIHGARRIRGGYPGFPAIDNSGTLPGNHQGWGRVDLRRSLFSHPPDPLIAADDRGWLPRRTIFIDSPNVTLNGTPAHNPNSRVTHDVRVTVADASVPLRATLVWTDYPGLDAAATTFTAHPGTILNQLQLSVVRVSDGRTYSVSDPPGLLPAPAVPPAAPPPPAPQPPPAPPLAHRNNVQQIDIPTAGANALAAGDYIVRVTAPTALPSVAFAGDEQDFALVISGPISRSDHANPDNMASLPDLAFVDLHNAAGDGRALHDGLPPSPERPGGNPGSPDIWVSREQNPDPARAVDRIEAGRPHYVYVRVRNLGFAAANDAQLSLYWADPSTPMTFPGDWNVDGFELGNVPTYQTNIDVPARGSTVAGPFRWTPPGGRESVALFARVETYPEDMIRHPNNLRLDNNVTRRDVLIQNGTTDVQEKPGRLGRFWFWVISGFGSPRDIEARWLMYYEDVTDGEVKPMPPGVTVEVWDFDSVTGDERLAEGRTVSSADPQGKPTSAMRLTFSTYESGERSPDLYLKVLAPKGEVFSDFRRRSYFVSGAPHWISRLQPNAEGGFFEEDFSGNRLGIPAPVSVVMRPRGIAVHAALEYQEPPSEEFKRLPAGIPVQILDSKVSAPNPILGRATTDEKGEIRAVLQQRTDHEPSVYFLIERDRSVDAFSSVDYFSKEERWDSRRQQGEIVARDGSVMRTVSGHFENVASRRLVAEGESLRFRLGSPMVFVHLRFEYFDRESAGFQSLPKGVEVQIWEDDAAATSPLVVGAVGNNGRVDLAVPKGTKQRLNLFARVVMRKRLESEYPVQPDVRVHSGGGVVTWDTKGRTATDGTAGLFQNVETGVPAAGVPLVFRIGTGSADANVEFSAPFILKVIGELHDWLRIRTAKEWQGIFSSLQINLFNSAAEGSRSAPTTLPTSIDLNTGHTAPDTAQLNLGNVQPDHWNRIVIAHHYGHLVLEAIITDQSRPAVGASNHRDYRARVELTAAGSSVSSPLAGRRLAFAEGFADFLAFRHLVQDGRPNADVSSGGWSGSTGGNLFSNIAGAAPDDDSVIRSRVNPASDACEVRLSTVSDPRTDATFVPFTPLRAPGYLVRFRFRNTERGHQARLTMKLMEGATEVASWSLLSTSSDWTTAIRTLSPQQADSITNYANLRLRFIATAHKGLRQRIEISWAEFELPHPERPDRDPARPRDRQQVGWRGADDDGAKNSGEIVPMAVANALWHLDMTVVGWGHAGIEEPVNQRRFLGLIWNPIKSLQTNDVQVPYQLYRAVQSARLGDEDWIDRVTAKTRQEVRRVFEANGMVFTRGQISAPAVLRAQNLATVPPQPALATFQVQPADRARLNVAEMGRIKAYRIDAAPTGTTNFVELDTFVLVTAADQRATVVANLTEARQIGVLTAGAHDFRVRAMDEFDTWDTFADNLGGNTDTAPTTGVIDNNTWLRNRLRTIRPLPGDPAPASRPINVP